MPDVELVRWPLEAERRAHLAKVATPRLLLIDHGSDPPPPADCLEDWMRVPAPDIDLRVRVEALSARAAAHAVDLPDLDGDGVLRYGGLWVSLPPVEGRLLRLLIERFGAVVGRDALTRAGWPDGSPGRNALDVHILRLRRRLTTVGLGLKTVRSRGYLLEAVGIQASGASSVGMASAPPLAGSSP